MTTQIAANNLKVNLRKENGPLVFPSITTQSLAMHNYITLTTITSLFFILSIFNPLISLVETI